MVSYEVCRKMLLEDGEHYTEEDIKKISELLWQFAELTVDQFLNQSKTTDDETCNSNGEGKL